MGSRTAKIIVADDSKTSTMFLSILLDRMGFEVIPAEDGEATLKLTRMTRPDLILLDIVMPKLDGFGVLKRIKMDKEIAETPIVMVTVKGDKRTEEKCRELGCVGFIRKPVELRQLHEHLERCVFRKSQRRRKWLRAQFNRRISVTLEDITKVYFAPILSEGGIYVRTKDPLPLGAEVQVAVALDGGKKFFIQGRIIYHRHVFSDIFRMEPGMAIEFASVPSDAAAALSAYLANQLAGDLVEEQEEEVLSIVGQSAVVTM